MIEQEIKKVSNDYTKNTINGEIVFFVTINNNENSLFIIIVKPNKIINISWYIGTLKKGYSNHVNKLIEEHNMIKSNIKFKIKNNVNLFAEYNTSKQTDFLVDFLEEIKKKCNYYIFKSLVIYTIYKKRKYVFFGDSR